MPKPVKPYPTFPLTPHARGWVKKIKGRVVWIAGHVPAEEAIKVWHRRALELTEDQPQKPSTDPSTMTVRSLSTRWLEVKKMDAAAGVLGAGYYSSCLRAVGRFRNVIGDETLIGDLTPDDFSGFGRRIRAKFGPMVMRMTARLISAMFRHADDEDWIDRPVKLGKTWRKFANYKGEKTRRELYDPADVRRIVKASAARVARLKKTKERDAAAAIQFHAMLFLAINGGYGAADVAQLPRAVVDLDAALIDYRRGKTKIDRIVPLWPETVAAMREAAALRPGDEYMFRTREGNLWARQAWTDESGASTTYYDNVNQTFGKLVRPLGLKRKGQGFYTFKYLFRSTADEAGDQHAAFRLVGHALPAMADPYVQVTHERLRKVVDFVRHRLLIQKIKPRNVKDRG